MSVNKVGTDGSGPFSIIQDENVLTSGHPAEIELRVPATIQGPKRSEQAKGRIWVTDRRVVFITDSNPASGSARAYDAPPSLESVCIPYTILLSTKFELPIFSNNYILLSFLPDPEDPESGLPSPGRGAHIDLKVWINDGSGHGVWKRIEGERSRVEEQRNEGETLPAYEA